MEKLLKKLHSQRGETMLMALLLFLVGVMVSAVILAAAISAESDAKAAREEQQAYLTVSSAAELFRDALQSGSGGYREIVTKTYSGTQLQGTKTEKQNASGPFSEIFNKVIPTLLKSPSTYQKPFTLSMDGLEDVTMELSIQPKQGDNDQFILTAVFYNDPEGKHPCKMTLTALGVKTVSTEQKWGNYWEQYEATTTEMKWSQLTITRPRTQTGG